MKKTVLLIFAVLMCTMGAAMAQTRAVKGKVTSADDGTPIPGVTVMVKGSTAGTQTNADGAYEINVGANASLVFSFIGMVSQEVAVGNQSVLNVALQSSDQNLAEVVVTALGIQRDQKAIGYAVSKVDPATVLQRSEPDLLKGLQGKVPGVDIRASQGVPGSATRIQIRGISSFGLDTQPLIVVDGIPYSNETVTTSSQTSGGAAYGSGFANLDPNDIEDMTVLKGAAAAALYGSRASRGVVVITTKSGSGKKGAKAINVSYKGGFSVEEIANLPTMQNTYGAGANWRVQGANGSWGGKFGSGNIYNSTGQVIRKSSSGLDSIPASTWATMYSSYPELFPNGMAVYKAYPNNVKDLFQTGKMYENSVSINGGEGRTTFSGTISNVNHEGYVMNANYVRNNISMGGQTGYKNFTFGGNVSYSKSTQKGGFFGQTQSFLSQWGRTFTMARNWDIVGYPNVNRTGQQIGFNDGQYTNPVWGATHNVATSVEDRVTGRFYAQYKVNSWIDVNYNFGVNRASLSRDELIDESSYGGSGGENALGSLKEDINTNQEIQSTLLVIFKPRINDEFSLDVKLGNDINMRSSRRQTVHGVDFIVPGVYNIMNTNIRRFLDDSRSNRRLVGLFADATVGFRNYAFLNVSARQDQTSTLPYANARYFYPGLSGSIVYTDAFNIKSNVLSYGKIRAGWAKVGNDAQPQRGQDIFVLNNNGFMGLPRATRGSTTYDPNLTPEFTSEIEVGTDFALFKNRIAGEVTWYDKRSTNLIYAISVPTTTGYSSFYTNIGEIRNTGWEIGLTVKPIVRGDLNWQIRGVFTKNVNTVERLTEGIDRANIGSMAWIEPGMPYGYLRGDKSARDEKGNLLIDANTGFVYKDPNQQMVGDPTPKFKFGVTNSVSYKGLSANILWDMTYGGAMYSESVNSMLGRGTTKDTEDREWSAVIKGLIANPVPVVGEDGVSRYVPLLVDGQTVPNQTRITSNDLFFSGGGNTGSFATNGASEYSIYDATVYRLREISIGYDLPRHVVSRLKLQNINVSLSGRNLWYVAPNMPKYINFDPEIGSLGNGQVQGVELSGAPTAKRYGLNLNVTF
jgi:TonB-linked SusC/RagA family outer membrane protein